MGTGEKTRGILPFPRAHRLLPFPSPTHIRTSSLSPPISASPSPSLSLDASLQCSSSADRRPPIPTAHGGSDTGTLVMRTCIHYFIVFACDSIYPHHRTPSMAELTRSMSELVARTGRHQQRYENGYRLVAGCIPFKYRICDESSADEKIVEVLMINSTNGPGLLFPKGGWENDETVEQAAEREALEEAGVRGKIMDYLGEYFFKSKTLQDDFSPEGLCKAAMFALLVDEELQCWPEQSTRQRSWLSIPEAAGCCRYPWMREALEEGFIKWHANYVREEDHATTSPATSPGNTE